MMTHQSTRSTVGSTNTGPTLAFKAVFTAQFSSSYQTSNSSSSSSTPVHSRYVVRLPLVGVAFLVDCAVTVAVIKCCLRNLVSMTAVKTGVGLLYKQSDTATCKLIRAELTNRCSDVEIRADVAVDKNGGLGIYHSVSLNTPPTNLRNSKYCEHFIDTTATETGNREGQCHPLIL